MDLPAHEGLADRLALLSRLLQISTVINPEHGLKSLETLLGELGWSRGETLPHAHRVELPPPLGTYFCPFPAPPWLKESLDGVARQLVTRAQSKRRLAELEERTELLSEGGFEGLFVHRDGVVLEVNERLAEILRTSREALLGKGLWQKCVAPHDQARVVQRMSERREGTYVIQAVRFDGSLFWAELSVKELKRSDEALRIVGVRDVTESEQALRQLQESDERLRQLVNQAFDVTVYIQDGIIVDLTGPIEQFGLSRELMIGRSAVAFAHPGEASRVAKVIEERGTGRYETVLVVPNADVIPIEVVSVYAPLGGVSTRVSGLRDLRPIRRLEAERHRLELQMERAQRLDTVGVLAGGIAHDFNNLLVGILGNADLLSELVQAAPERELLAAIVNAGRRARDLTSRLLAYSGVNTFAVSAVHVGALITDIQQLHSFERSRGIRVFEEIDPEATVWGDRATLTQVLMNLISNGVEACEASHGHVTVRAQRTMTLDARWNEALGATVGPGEWILVEVEDNGLGMDSATVSRIFEPFFTTKAKGHGLGLASCLGIVQGHGGALHVRSELGRGTCFSLLLPAAKRAPSVEPPPTEPSPPTGQILVVDDEPLVRRQLRRSLELQGYTTLEAEDGAACLRILEGVTPSLLILDATMPGLSGADVVREVRRRELDVPILLTSGYMDTNLRGDLEPSAIDAFLAKPYRLQELMAAVALAIESRRRSPG
jgi:two-component system, cell cycle sensor histidine kinase and response regulator CckA